MVFELFISQNNLCPAIFALILEKIINSIQFGWTQFLRDSNVYVFRLKDTMK